MKIFGIFSAVCALALPAYTQSFTGSISGTIRDSSGAVVPQAAISVVNSATNVRSESKSDGTGNYSVLSLSPGGYTLEVAAAGFKKYVQKGITIDVQQTPRVDVILQVGDAAQSIEVAADTSSIETVSSAVGKVVETRHHQSAAQLAQRLQPDLPTPGVTGSIGNNYDGMTYSVNGARATMMDTLDRRRVRVVSDGQRQSGRIRSSRRLTPSRNSR